MVASIRAMRNVRYTSVGYSRLSHPPPAVGPRRSGGRAAVMAATLAAIVFAAGCSSSPSAPAHKPAAGPHVTGAASLTPAVDPKVAALVPAAIKAKGSVIVAMDATYPPNEFIGPDGHTIIGFDADLGRALGAVMGLKWNLTNASFDTIIPGLQSGKYDVGLSSFGDTLARQQVVSFVTYFQAGESFYIKAGAPSPVTSLASLCGKSLSVESGTTEEADAAAQGKKCTAGGKPGVHIEVYGNQNEANLAVSSG